MPPYNEPFCRGPLSPALSLPLCSRAKPVACVRAERADCSAAALWFLPRGTIRIQVRFSSRLDSHRFPTFPATTQPPTSVPGFAETPSSFGRPRGDGGQVIAVSQSLIIDTDKSLPSPPHSSVLFIRHQSPGTLLPSRPRSVFSLTTEIASKSRRCANVRNELRSRTHPRCAQMSGHVLCTCL